MPKVKHEYMVTKRAKGFVWLMWDAYGAYPPRGSSHRMTEDYFRENYEESPGSTEALRKYQRKENGWTPTPGE